ncbi:MAG: phosphoribosylformylglycinamidine synthase I [Alphaproteobacteria bacterium]|nr:phosphoribosylformylglycinamidine synthase I [Alphaproteobacteria bacterium]
MKPPILVLHAPGTNRDRDAALACTLAGGAPEIVPIARLIEGEVSLADYRMLMFPGGFSFGDDLGAGVAWAALMRASLGEQLQAFVDSGRPVLGICNGFQVLVKLGLLPGVLAGEAPLTRHVTLTHNDSGRFECRWVRLKPQADSPCVFTRDLDEDILCPVAHGEGRLVTADDAVRAHIRDKGLAALRYVAPDGSDAQVPYPANPNGSEGHIAGLTNPAGNVLGLMPHPEDHVFARQHPRAQRGERGNLGLALFQAGVRYAGAC